MISRLRDWSKSQKNRRAFRRAADEAKNTGGTVCGTYRDGKPVYFVVSKNTPDLEIEARAFREREGRSITNGELILKASAPALARKWGSSAEFLADADARMKGLK